VISGHDGLVEEQSGLAKIDSSKKWRRPQGRGRMIHPGVSQAIFVVKVMETDCRF